MKTLRTTSRGLLLVLCAGLLGSGLPAVTATAAAQPRPQPPPLPVPPQPAVVCVDFEPPLLLGTRYGRPVGQSPGDLAFTSQRVRVTVEKYLAANAATAFEVATVVNPPRPFAAGQSLRLNNVDVQLDFRALGFRPARVALRFLDLGGAENLAVNGSPLYAGELAAAPTPIGGVALAVATTPLPPPAHGKTGTLKLTGPVATLRIGGQELWIDQVCASR
ncbi:MAG TPA: hypothetical protein VGV61_11895 [Thermoanaerobaculia bacterium]|nr:hypothetical protein [Thermoanaerobaculia bacterium]